MEPFIGQIILFGGNFAPSGWAFCDGQLLPISQNTALFSILGTIYGGDGETTFALPDLRGRAPIHEGVGPGLTPRPLGQKAGAQSINLSTNQLPSHTHAAPGRPCNSGEGNLDSPVNAFPAENGAGAGYHNTANAVMGGSTALGNTGGNQSVSIMQPYLAVNFIIALLGIFPSQN